MSNARSPDLTPSPKRDLLVYGAIIALALAGNASVSLKPILVGSYVEFLGFAPSRAGIVLTAEASATSLATFAAALVLNRWDRRRMIVLALILIALGNIASLGVDAIGPLAMIRAFTGIGHGIALALTGAAIANYRLPDRMAGVVTVSISALGISLMLFVPWLQGSFGIQPLFLTMASMALPPLLFLKILPIGSTVANTLPNKSADIQHSVREQRKIEVIFLLGVGSFFVSVGSFWPFAQQIGQGTGLAYDEAARATAFASLAAIFGALTAIGLRDRIGRTIPITASVIGAVCGLSCLLVYPNNALAFVIGVTIYMFCWASLYPYLLGFGSFLDPTGRVNALIFGLALTGFAIGPALGSVAITAGSPQGGSNLANLVILSLLCLLPAASIIYSVIVERRLCRREAVRV